MGAYYKRPAPAVGRTQGSPLPAEHLEGQANAQRSLAERRPDTLSRSSVLHLQRFAGNRATADFIVQRDIKGSNDVPLGTFAIDMAKKENPGDKSGEDGTVSFTPNKKKGPRTNDIRLSQIVRTVDFGTTKDVDWSKVGAGGEADRNKMMTSDADRTHVTRSGDTLESVAQKYYGDPFHAPDIANDPANKPLLKSTDPKKKLPKGITLKIPGAVKGGSFIDHLAADPNAVPRTSKADKNVPQDYVWPGEEIPGKNEHGFKKKKEIKAASLKDFPGVNQHWSFTFETAARSVDVGIYYGSIHWSFEVDVDKVKNETFRVTPGVSETFRQALFEFDKFYKNKHVVLKGETLSSISQKYYGTPDKWRDIFKANKEKIKNPNHIEPGWQLTIPRLSAE